MRDAGVLIQLALPVPHRPSHHGGDGKLRLVQHQHRVDATHEVQVHHAPLPRGPRVRRVAPALFCAVLNAHAAVGEFHVAVRAVGDDDPPVQLDELALNRGSNRGGVSEHERAPCVAVPGFSRQVLRRGYHALEERSEGTVGALKVSRGAKVLVRADRRRVFDPLRLRREESVESVQCRVVRARRLRGNHLRHVRKPGADVKRNRGGPPLVLHLLDVGSQFPPQRLARLQHRPAEAPAHRATRTRAFIRPILVFLYPDDVPVGLAHPPGAPLQFLRVAPVPEVCPDPQPHELVLAELRVLHHDLHQVHVRGGRVLARRVLVFIVVPEEHPVYRPGDHELLGSFGAQRVLHRPLLCVVPLPVHAVRSREEISEVEVALGREVLQAGRLPCARQARTLALSPLRAKERRAARADGDGEHLLVVLHLVADAVEVILAPVHHQHAGVLHGVIPRRDALEHLRNVPAPALKHPLV